MDISERIKIARKKNKLTQKDLAEKTGLSIASIQGYEQGKYKPKIEQIDKIASALGVQIIDLMEHYTFEQYKNTKEFQKHMKEGNAIEGVLSILREIYGEVEDKEVSGNYSCSNYYLCGEGNQTFTLYEGDIWTLHDAIKSLLPPIINRLKDTRPENEIVAEIKKDCDAPFDFTD